jgi:hypothetical protein
LAGRQFPAGGFAYIALLIMLVGIALTALSVAETSRHVRQREAEAQLLFAGRQYREAIERFTNRDVGALRGPPRRLEDLLEDTRGPVVQRHIRRLYIDPLSGRADWALLRDARGGLIGVHSRSLRVPLRRTGFERQEADFSRARNYSEWRFTVRPATGSTGASNPPGIAPGALPSGAASPQPGEEADLKGDFFP